MGNKELTILKKAIIEKIHGLPWEEARWEEMSVEGCEILSDNHVYVVDGDNFIVGCKECQGFECGNSVELSTPDKSLDKFTVLGLPITLSRVLQVMREMDIFGGYIYHNGDTLRLSLGEENYMYWKLLKEDKSTAILEDQSEDTIEALTKIFL